MVLLILIVGSVGYTSRPSFCSSCHYMVPFYEGWQQSAHNDVDCTVCHFEPGLAGTVRGKIEGLLQVAKYVTNAYKRTKPWAEISDESCLRSGCHVEELLKANVIFKEGITFDHGPHLSELRKGKSLRCTSCHSQIVQGDHITVTETTCFLCHFKNESVGQGLAECTLCHKQENFLEIQDQIRYDHSTVFEKGYDCLQCHTNTIVGDGAVHLEDCYDCHFEPDKLAKLDDGEFLHKVHIADHKIECLQCHLTIQHKIVKTTEGDSDDCSSCHVNLHIAQRTLFSGELNGHTTMPNPMQEIGLNCKGCHIFHEETGNIGEETFKADSESCERCHGEGYSRLFKLWEDFADRRIKIGMKDYRHLTELVEGVKLDNSKRSKVNRKLEKAFGYIELVNRGKAVHNIRFSEELLSEAGKRMSEVVEMIGVDYEVSEFERSANVIPGDCINCHVDVVDDVVTIFGLEYSHEKHLVKVELECKTCHSNVNRHGELKLEKTQCLSCHHTQEEKECSYCHEIQFQFYSGEISGYSDLEPDIMFEEEISCNECHRNDLGNIVRTPIEQCVECHDDDYGHMVSEWKEINIGLIEDITNNIILLNNQKLMKSEINRIREAKKLLSIINRDGSYGLHNFESINGLLERDLSNLDGMKQVK